MNSVIFMLICAALTVSGQVLWKISFTGITFRLNWEFFSQVLLSGTFWLGTFVYIIATLIWFYALSKYDLSYVAPLMSVTYIFSLIAGSIVFNESIGMYKILGVICIVSGAFFISK